MGGIGQVDYSAANAFLGAFARSRSARGGMPVIAIDWCEWRWDRWAEMIADPRVRESLKHHREIIGLTFAEGMEALDRILESGLPEVVVSTRDLAAAIDAEISTAEILAGWADLLGSTPDRKGHPRPALQTPWAAPSTATEERLAAIWGELLGIEPIGAHDNFFELGGHSLLGLQLVSRLRGELGVELPLGTLFEAPALAALAREVDTLCRRGGAVDAALPPPILPVPREAPLPLSFAQQRLWFIDQLEPGTAVYNMPVVLRVEGRLRAAVLARCLGEIVRRHEALRTVFAAREGSPVQVIQPAEPFLLPVVDLAGWPESARESLALALAQEEAGRPFDLTRGPLLRGVLLRLAAEEHVLALTLHHIASDGWSVGILVREVTALYAAVAAGRPSPLPELPVQYADFSVWQHSLMQGEMLDRELSFWRRQLAGLPPLLELPTDRPRPAKQSFKGASRSVRLPVALARQAQSLSQREGGTLFMVLLAGFQALLLRLSGQDDLAVGSPVAGRTHREVEPLIGFFVNTLVLRADFAGAPSFVELVARVRRQTLDAYAHQDVPFERLVEELAPQRSLAYTPLFQVMFVLQNAPVESLEIRDLRLRPVGGSGTTAKFDLSLSLGEREGELAGELEYATDLFDAATIDRLAGHFGKLLDAALATPHLPVAALPLLGAGERQQLLVEWSDTAVFPAREAACLHELFEAQARRTPEAVALIDGSEEILYRELDAAAERLASRLREGGAGPERIVGVGLERSAGLLVALLAILKTGAAYLPLDSRQPRRRLAATLESARVALVLSTESLAAELPWSGPWVLVDRDVPAANFHLPTPPASRAVPENLAYVLYTSGSTGTPKGVAVTHRSAVALVLWAGSIFAREELSGVLAATALSFDLSVFELFVPLSLGGTVILAQNVLELPALPSRGRVTLLNTVPSAMSELVRAGSLEVSIRTVCLAGEPLPGSLAERLYATGTVERVWNLYGPSEDTTYSTASLVRRVGQGSAEAPGIGRPVTATKAYVLAAGTATEPQPVGVTGELYLGGAGLARGYLHRPDRTAERFVPDPWPAGPGEAGARLYRTGDLVRLRPDGSLDFLGRLDHQVKIRGFRIELGEIEAALSALQGVREVVVAVREDRTGGRRLVAYVVGEVPADALRGSLQERLPDYMVPAAFVTLEALPLTPNGKVDRKALPAAEEKSAEESSEAPRTPVEEVLAGIWAEVLGLERVGADGHFFALGGHSLLATRVTSRLRDAFGIEMPLRELFEAPRLTELAVRVEASLRTLRSGAGSPVPPLAPIAPALRTGPLPLSFAQQRLWFIDQLEPGSPLYNLPVTLRVEGPLAASGLALCLGEVVRRHQALRTVFAAPEGSPVQVIQPAAPFALPVVDLSGLPETGRESLALALLGEEAVRPFDLARGPLLRGLLLRLAASGETADHVAALTQHHIASDGWSLGILVREVTALYAALAEDAAGRPSPLPELAVQYVDFAVWQRSWLEGEILAREIAFWRRQLAGLPPLLELPTDRPRPAVQSFRGASRPVLLPARLTRQVEALARRQGATLFMVLLAGFEALLARLSGQEDLAVGSPVAGRTRREVEPLIGFFVNTLVHRGDLTGEPSFRELLGRVRETALLAYMHQDVPFEKLVEELAPERSLAHTPLFQVMLALQNAPLEILEIPGLRLRPVDGAGATAKFDLSLSFAEQDGELAGTVEYATDLFDGATLDRLTVYFERLVAAAIAEEDRPVADLPLLSPAELHQVRSEWNPPAAAPPASDISVIEMFESWAKRTPDALAVLAPGEALTYAELDARANRLARRLRSLGVTIDGRVGLCAERSPAMILAVLGILKAGAAYVPLDPAYPRERLAFMVEDARIPVLLTEERLLDCLPGAAATTLLLDAGESGLGDLDGFGGARAERLPGVATLDSLAYLIYTSGSTGRPKGVMIHHRGWSNLAAAQRRLFGVGPGDRVLQFASLNFDASAWEIAMAFGAGATLVLGSRERRLAGEELTALLKESTAALLPPTVLATLSPEDLPGLLTLIVGGEACPVEVAKAWTGGRRLWNAYGPTEATVCVTVKLYDGGDRLPIGWPIERMEAWVLDAWGSPAPVGVVGELCLGGPGLARGYLSQPGPTALSFVPHALATLPGERLYRTGDLALRRPDGSLEFLGRLDQQVKIRGFRVELGEIEAALAALPGVREAAVMVREDRPGDRRLVAYVADGADGAGDARAAVPRRSWREQLHERLPDYMIPAAFVRLAALPLTANGKVDRRALPAPERQRSAASPVAPRTAVEEVLAGIWSEVLGVERVGSADHFFDLGGHSLLATQVMSRLRSIFGVELPLRTLFEAPALADLAARIEAALRTSRVGAGVLAPPLAPIASTLRTGPLPLSFAQQRLWFIDQLEPGSPLYNIPVALRIEGPLASTVLAFCLGEIVRRHEALRTVFVSRQDSPVQVIQPAAPLALPLVDLSGLPEDARETLLPVLAGEEASHPFDLARGPLLRGLLLRLAERDHLLAVTLHHIAGDGWSMGILIREVAALYAAFAAGRPSPLPELPVQYADFAVWQSSWLQGEVLAGEIAFWRRQLAGLPPLLELPTDRPRPAVQSFRGANRPVPLPAGLTRQLAALARREGATLFMVLLAGFQALLARTSRQDDLAVGSPIAGRNRIEIEGLIGFFVNTLVLRGDLSAGRSGEPSFRELVDRARETALLAYMHQDVPFEKLVEELAPERSLTHSPLFQVMLVLQNAPAGSLEIGDLRLLPVAVEGTTAKFDLTLTFVEHDGELVGTFEYASGLFDAATIDRQAGHLERLLRAASGTPDEPFSTLPLLSLAERGQLLVEWNDTASGEAPRPVHELFAAQVRRTPEAVAVVFLNEQLTYAGLDTRASRLARRLRALGVGPDVLVGLLVERSLDMIVGVLGILQAGGVYVPFDPQYPVERVAFMLDDTRAPVLLTQEPLRDRLPAGSSTVLLLDREEGGAPLVRGAVDAVDGDGFPAAALNLGYVIYTSGSTGRPKGVALSQWALRNLIDWHLATLLGGARTLQFASLSFDASFHEMFACWGSGGTLVVVPEELRRDLAALAELLVEQEIEKAILPVVVLQQLAEIFAGRESLPPLCEITTTGERLQTNRAIAALLQRLPGCAFHNHYGPSETHVATAFTLSPDPADWTVYPSVGRPIGNSTAYVFEPGLVPAPIGVPGDLYLGGACLARGYLGRPDLTAQRFVPHPCGDEPGARLYRTGDKVRFLANGDLDFLGRFDDQVKIRGFRVEPGEIEALLLTMAGVREAVVVVREDRSAGGSSADRRLVAYVAGVAGGVEAEVLRRALREKLPDYMVPAACVVLPALPLTLNGKVDRRALPAPERLISEESYVAPRTPVEEVLAGIWAEVLGLERVGAKGHFFELGGHSLLATRVTSRLRSAFGIELPLRTLFERPTVAELAAFVEEARRGGMPSAVPRLMRVERGDDLPLSFAQERLWFLDSIDPGAPTYNMPGAIGLLGRLDVAALAAALLGVVDRHEVLRTVFRVVDGVPRQHILPAPGIGGVGLPIVDLAALPEAGRRAETERLAAEHARHRFDLASGPLLDAALLRLEADRHHLFVVMHHVICDGWSLHLLVREIGELYGAFTAHRPSPLSELPVQYADFAVWQREVVAATRQTELAWWLRLLSGEVAPLDLPTDRPRPPVQTFRGGHAARVLPPGLSGQLTRFGRSHGATLFMTLVAAIQALLHRHSGQDDILVGAPVAGRRAVETEELLGCFLNTLVLRTGFGGQPGFSGLVEQVREVTLGAYSHQDVPFEAVLAALPVERDLSRTPLFQVMVNLLNFPVVEMRLPGGLEVETERMAPAAPPSKLEMTFYLSEEQGGVSVELIYNADLFDAVRMEDLLDQLALFLEQALERPEEPLGHHTLVTPRARAVLPEPAMELSAAWEGAAHEIFARHAERAPVALAVADPAESWTYGELDERADRLAAFLQAGGVRPGDVVAFWAHRSAPLVWGVLGALKAGAAFLMLDPRYPAPRQAQMLAIARPAAWLRVAAAGPVPVEIESALDALECACRLALPARADEVGAGGFLADVPAASRVAEVGPDDIAYVAFTSGSTGVPKGVLGRHGSLSHFIPWLRHRFELSAADRFSLLSGLAHDPLHRDLFTPLQIGAAVVIPDPETMDEPGRLAVWMRQAGVSVAHLTPALGQVLTTDAPDAPHVEVPSLRYAFLVGDVLTRRDVARLRRLAPQGTSVNYYGSTETQRAVSYHVAEDGEPREVLPLGRGIPDVQLLVRNPAGGISGIGELGEVSVRSPHIALGYLDDPRLTEERFVADPWSGREGDRLYRTGDLGRYLPNGEAVFAGRADTQVKIRGFRIELGEIESVLGGFPGVREAVVVARQAGLAPSDSGAELSLAAYVVPAAAATLGVPELRAFLRERLPDSMVPATFTLLDELPLTPNRKVDRKALPAPQWPNADDGHVAPRTPVEEVLAGIWAELLGVERVGATDHFFDLGGHSLLATRVVSRLRSAFGVEMPLRDLFLAPRLADLAVQVEAMRRTDTMAPAPPLVPVPGGGPRPLSFAQQRLWFIDQLEPGSPLYNLPVALRIEGRLDAALLAVCLGEIVRRHEALRTVFAVSQGGEGWEGSPVQVVRPAAPFVLPLVDLSGLPETARDSAVRALVREEGSRPFDLARDLLLRGVLLRVAASGRAADHVAALTLHHIASDGWSLGILVREVTTLYAALAEGTAGRPSPLPELPVQYADFSVWQRSWFAGEILAAEIAFWRRQLAALPPRLELPTDRPYPAIQSFRGGSRSMLLPAGLTRQIEALARRSGTTLFMVLLAGFQALLARASGQDDLAVGSPVAGRTHREVEGLIGFFVNTLVMRGDLSGAPSFLEWLGRVRETALSAYMHQDLPFERLVEDLAPERSLAHTPLFQVMFALQNFPFERVELLDLAVTSTLRETATAKFELGLTFTESGGELQAQLDFAADLFDPSTILRLAGQLTALLAGATADPGRRLRDLPFLSEGECHQLRAEWNDTFVPAASALPGVVELFAAQARRSPEAVAVVLAGEDAGEERRSLTYRALDRRSDRLARRLRALGAGPGVPVGLCVERTPDLVVAVLAILKSGGAWLSLDPTHPQARLAFLLKDAAVPLLVGARHLLPILPPYDGKICLLEELAEAGEEVGGEGARAAQLDVPARDSLAYLIYTSGTTGRPKAVEVEHGMLAATLAATQARFRFAAGDRMPCLALSTFDIFLFELLSPLLGGGTAVLFPLRPALDVEHLVDRLGELTCLHAVPALLRQVVDAVRRRAGAPDLSKLRAIFVGGDTVPAELLEDVRETFPAAQTWVLYGPTEGTILCAAHPVPRSPQPAVPLLGRPLAGAVLDVRGADGERLPIGALGELWIGGMGVTRGYLGRAELTAEKYVLRGGERFYRSGDRVRRRADGTLEFLGRLDHQVKVRGFRIELGEVESSLARHPEVRDAVAVVQEEASGKRLVAYVVRRQAAEITAMAPTADARPPPTRTMSPAGRLSTRRPTAELPRPRKPPSTSSAGTAAIPACRSRPRRCANGWTGR